MRLLFLCIFSVFLVACNSSNQPDLEPPKPKLPKEGSLPINGVDLYYKIIGQGEPMIVVHGGPGLDHSYLLPQMEVLAQDYQLIFFDQRACGKSASDIDSTEMTINHLVEDIEALRKALNLDKIHLLGHSWGGFLALKYGIRYSKQLKSLVVSNTMAPTSDMLYQEDSLWTLLETEEDLLALDELVDSEAYQNETVESYEDLFRIYFRKEFYHQHYVDSLSLDLPDNFIENAFILDYLFVEIEDYNILDELKHIQCPTLILYGDLEPSAKVSGDSIRIKIPHSKLQVIPNCGHFPYIEAQEAFLSALRNFHKKE